MATRRKPTLWLDDIRNYDFEEDHFRISKMEGTILYRVGQCLSSLTVQDLINQGWKVIIQPSK